MSKQGKVSIVAKSGVKLEIPDGAVIANKVFNYTSIFFCRMDVVMMLTPSSGIKLVFILIDLMVELYVQEINGPEDL